MDLLSSTRLIKIRWKQSNSISLFLVSPNGKTGHRHAKEKSPFVIVEVIIRQPNIISSTTKVLIFFPSLPLSHFRMSFRPPVDAAFDFDRCTSPSESIARPAPYPCYDSSYAWRRFCSNSRRPFWNQHSSYWSSKWTSPQVGRLDSYLDSANEFHKTDPRTASVWRVIWRGKKKKKKKKHENFTTLCTFHTFVAAITAFSLTPGGPKIPPFQSVRKVSPESTSPNEMDISPCPFSLFSSSSRSLKLRGTMTVSPPGVFFMVWLVNYYLLLMTNGS